MARTAASLSAEARVTDYISLGVITSVFPQKAIRSVLTRSGKASVRERELPAQVVIYYVIAQALFMQVSQREVLRCLLEGVRWLFGPRVAIKVTGKSGISQARSRLRWEPVKQLHDTVSNRLRSNRREVPGTKIGSWSAWTAAPWRWPTAKRTNKPLGGLAPAVAAVPILKSALCP